MFAEPRSLGRLLARMDQAPVSERLHLESGLIVSAYGVAQWARITREKLRKALASAREVMNG